MRLWRWFARNVKSFQALAALAFSIAAIIGLPVFLWNLASPDLILSFQRHENTMPVDLIQWNNKVAKQLVLPPSLDPAAVDYLQQFAAPYTTKRLASLSYLERIERLTLILTNQKNRTVSGTRIRVSGVEGPLWSVHAKGSFLTEEEANTFAQQVKSSTNVGNRDLVLPELPPLPAQNTLTIEIFGTFELFPKVIISAPTASSQVKEIISIPRSWLIDLYKMPASFFIICLFLLILCILPVIYFLPYFASWIRSRILYNAACREAEKPNRGNAAMFILEATVNAGFSKYERAKNDPRLKSLREREDFKRLVRDI